MACEEERRGVYSVLVGRTEGKTPPEDLCVGGSIILEWILNEIGCNGLFWIDLAHDRHKYRAVVNKVMNLRFPQNTGNFLTCGRSIRFSGRALVRGFIQLID